MEGFLSILVVLFVLLYKPTNCYTGSTNFELDAA